MHKNFKGTGWLVAILLITAIAGGSYGFAIKALSRRYDVLTASAITALDRGNPLAAARLTMAAMQGRRMTWLHFDNTRAESLLLEALLKDQPILTQYSARQYPQFRLESDVVPLTSLVSDDGTKIMILHNEKRYEWIYDIYNLSSGKLLSRFPSQLTADFGRRSVAGFSPDLNTTIIAGRDGVFFRDTLSQKPVLTNVKSTIDFFPFTVSNDRKYVSGTGTNTFRVWQSEGSGTQAFDYHAKAGAYMDGFFLSPNGSTLVTEDKFLTEQIRDAKTHAVRLTLESNGPVEITFTPDNRFMISSQIVGENQDHTGWAYKVHVWNADTFQPEGSSITLPTFVASASVIQDHTLALATMTGVTFWDRRTHRIIATAPNISSGWGEAPGWHDLNAYTISVSHVVTTYDLSPLLTMTTRDLTAKACGKWGKGLQLTKAEVAQMKLHITFDPCAMPL